MKREIYVSVDVEADGPIPGPYSMLSLGAVALVPSRDPGEVSERREFSVNLETILGASSDPSTMAFWAAHPEAYAATRVDQQNPKTAMLLFSNWLDDLPGSPVFVGYPASYDFMFTYWYLMRFVGYSRFGFAALDMKTLAWTLLGGDFRAVNKRRMPRHWFDDAQIHDHVAVNDARGQLVLFYSMWWALRATRPAAHGQLVGETDGRDLHYEKRRL